MLPHGAAQMFQRSDVGLDDGPTRVAGPARTLPAAVSIDLPGIGGQKRVARPPLAAFQRFEQKPVWALVQFCEGRDRRVSVQHDLPRDRHHAASGSSSGEGLEARGHWGAAIT